jgi:putative transposase
MLFGGWHRSSARQIQPVSDKAVLTLETLWNEVERYVERWNGWLILDDTVIDKVYSEQIGKHHKIVKRIGLITLVWTDGVNTFPVDFRIYDKDGDERSKNDHFREIVMTASTRGFQPYFVMFDSWYSGIDN